jgi:hypothetical protein
MLLAYLRDGDPLTPGKLNSSFKLDGEGPYRLIPPKKIEGTPDRPNPKIPGVPCPPILPPLCSSAFPTRYVIWTGITGILEITRENGNTATAVRKTRLSLSPLALSN